MGPSAIRYAGLHERLAVLGYQIQDQGNLAVPLVETCAPPALDETLRYLEPIAAFCAVLADGVAEAVARERLPLVLGGDHSLALGSVAGSARNRRLGLIWIDAHADFNTEATTPSGNIHGMPLAALTGRGHPVLTRLGKTVPIIPEERVALIGVRNLDFLERETLRASGVTPFTMHDIDRRGMAVVMEQALSMVTRDTEGFHVSFDMDVLEPREAPGVGTPVPGGISYREAHLALEMAAQTAALRSMDIVEVNPILDERNATAILAVDLILSALGKSTL